MNDKRSGWFIALIFLLIAGCATPAEVKQLSVKQAEYFDAAIEAVALQSKALITASEKLADIAKREIDQRAGENETLYVELLTKQPDEDNIQQALSEMSVTVEKASIQKAKLEDDLAQIKAKSEELKQYLIKMKEVHKALDAYVQSEKAGEKVVKDVLAQPSVNALLSTTGNLIPKVQDGIDELNGLLNQIGE